MSTETPLTAACKYGQKDIVEILLHNPRNPDINKTNIYGQTALQVAIQNKHEDIVKILINNRADLNMCQPSDSRLVRVKFNISVDVEVLRDETVWKAIRATMDKEALKALEVTEEVKEIEVAYTLPIVAAYQSQQSNVVRCLLKGGASYKPLVEFAKLRQLCEVNDTNLIQHFLKVKTETTDSEYAEALDISVNVGNAEIVEHLLTHHGPYTTAHLTSALVRACEIGSQEIVDMLLQKDTDLLASFQHDSSNACPHPLCIAMRKMDASVTKKLLNTQHSAPRQHLQLALTRACEEGSQDMVELIVTHDNELVKSFQHGSRQFCQHPLCSALRNSHLAVIATLQKNGATLILSDDSDCQEICHELCENGFRELCSRKNDFNSIFHTLIPVRISTRSLGYGLVESCKVGKTNVVRLLLQKLDGLKEACDILHDDTEGVTPLHAAIVIESTELVGMLLHAKADPSKAGQNNETPLYTACRQEHFELVTKLIDAGADPNPDVYSPLMLACQRSYIDIVQLLLEHGAKQDPLVACEDNLHTTSSNQKGSQENILLKAHQENHHEVVRLLLEYGANPSALSDVGLENACTLGYAEVARYIIQRSPKSLTQNLLKRCVENALQNGFLETALELVIDIEDNDLQQELCRYITQLIGTGNTEENTAGDEEMSDEYSQLPLLWQHYNNKERSKVRELIKDGHNVNIPNTGGRSLLQESMSVNDLPLIRDLCNSPNIEVNQPDIYGRTALFYSVNCLHFPVQNNTQTSVFAYLLEKRADADIRDKFGRTPLHEWACVSDGINRGPALEDLLKVIDVNSVDCKSQTPLHIATAMNNTNRVKQLLKHGGKREARDINGITPLYIAKRNAKNREVYEVLQDYPNHRTLKSESTEEDSDPKHVYMSHPYHENTLIAYVQSVFQENKSYHTKSERFQPHAGNVYYTLKPEIKHEMKSFTDTIIALLKEINEFVRKEVPELSFEPILSGSCAEGTKVIEMDEADILCVFEHSCWNDVTLSPVATKTMPQNDPSFVQIVSTNALPQFVTGKTISKKKLLSKLYSLIKTCLPEVLRKSEYNRLYVIDLQKALENDHSIACINMVWHGEELTWQEFSFDVVPAISVQQEQLPASTRDALKHRDILQGLYIIPKTGDFDLSQFDSAFRVSFSTTERDLFHAMPVALRHGYMLTKVLKHDCLTINDYGSEVCSYNLKTATFECMKTECRNWKNLVEMARDDRTRGTTIPESTAPPEDVIKYARMILSELENAVVEKKQMSFFLRRCDLMTHSVDKTDDRQTIYIRYCKALLCDADDVTWTNLVEVVSKLLLTQENINEKCFVQDTKNVLDMGLNVSVTEFVKPMIKLRKLEGLKMLLEKHASVEDVDGKGSSAFQLAQEAPDILRFLYDNVQGKFNLHMLASNLKCFIT
jgi:ankyrin repeat protein